MNSQVISPISPCCSVRSHISVRTFFRYLKTYTIELYLFIFGRVRRKEFLSLKSFLIEGLNVAIYGYWSLLVSSSFVWHTKRQPDNISIRQGGIYKAEIKLVFLRTASVKLFLLMYKIEMCLDIYMKFPQQIAVDGYTKKFRCKFSIQRTATSVIYYASPTSGEAYRNRRLTTYFEL